MKPKFSFRLNLSEIEPIKTAKQGIEAFYLFQIKMKGNIGNGFNQYKTELQAFYDAAFKINDISGNNDKAVGEAGHFEDKDFYINNHFLKPAIDAVGTCYQIYFNNHNFKDVSVDKRKDAKRLLNSIGSYIYEPTEKKRLELFELSSNYSSNPDQTLSTLATQARILTDHESLRNKVAYIREKHGIVVEYNAFGQPISLTKPYDPVTSKVAILFNPQEEFPYAFNVYGTILNQPMDLPNGYAHLSTIECYWQSPPYKTIPEQGIYESPKIPLDAQQRNYYINIVKEYFYTAGEEISIPPKKIS